MRFGISATSSIFPKNLRTRLRPVKVCAIVASLLPPPAPDGRRGLPAGANARAGRCSERRKRNLFRQLHANPARTETPGPETSGLMATAMGGNLGKSGSYIDSESQIATPGRPSEPGRLYEPVSRQHAGTV